MLLVRARNINLGETKINPPNKTNPFKKIKCLKTSFPIRLYHSRSLMYLMQNFYPSFTFLGVGTNCLWFISECQGLLLSESCNSDCWCKQLFWQHHNFPEYRDSCDSSEKLLQWFSRTEQHHGLFLPAAIQRRKV